jgi:surfeit locus 1 family protein
MQMGERVKLSPPYPVVANFPTHEEIAALLHEAAWTPATDLVLLDAGDPDGYWRQWQAPGFPPMRHVAYAVQWFGLALALAVIYVVTNLRRDTGKEGA